MQGRQLCNLCFITPAAAKTYPSIYGKVRMYEVEVLKEGYTVSSGGERFRSCGTVTLIKGSKHVILVDTGNPWDRDFILQKLKERNISPSDISYVVCTHGHSDHVGNLNLFTQATCIVSYDICQRDQYVVHAFDKDIPYEIDNDVEVIATPGHTAADVSVVVYKTQQGTIAITGDLFECEEDLKNASLWQANSHNPKLQQEYRDRVLSIANHIVPGHGPSFDVVESYRRQGSVTEPSDVTEGEMIEAVDYNVVEAD